MNRYTDNLPVAEVTVSDFPAILIAFLTSADSLPNVEDCCLNCCTSFNDKDLPVPSYLKKNKKTRL